MGLRDAQGHSDDPYAGLDVDPIGKVDVPHRASSFPATIPKAALRDDRIPIDPDDVGVDEYVTFRVGVSKEIRGRIVFDLEREQLPSPPDR